MGETASTPSTAELECVTDRDHASSLLHPLRLRILSLAREPVSSSELGGRLGLARQRVNYHVRELARAGFLRRAGRRRRRNMFEQRYVATSRAYVFSPELLGPLKADWKSIADAQSAEYLLALLAQMQVDLVRAWKEASRQQKRLSTLSLKSQFRFESPRQREEFARMLRQAVVEVIARYTSPYAGAGGSPGAGSPFRLVLGCYPYVPEGE